jgi:hypothetical protein
MADWKQITARIRRARTSKDPAAQLANLFEKTRDAMVAFELAKHFETSAQNSDALKWYATAAERFRRADWKSKAHDAIVRLGGTIAESEETLTPSATSDDSPSLPVVVPEPALPAEHNAAALESMIALTSEVQSAAASSSISGENSATGSGRGRRRRGRRGGRNRNRSEAANSETAQTALTQPTSEPQSPAEPRHRHSSSRTAATAAERAEPGLRGRFGDPGLSSRLTLLEMQFRRLLTCPAARLDQADKAPAGPGVFVLTDDELTSYYYVEACDTLRVAIGQLARGSTGRRGNPALKAQFAEHLGITEARVGKYLTDHCVVRWLQLDEGAAYFAHYAIAVLRPLLND